MSQCQKCGCQVESPFDGKTIIHDVERCGSLAPAHGSVLCAEMQRVFGLPPARWACPTLYSVGRLVCDPALLERGIAHVHPVPDGVSLKEHIRTHYGEAAVDLVLRAIGGEDLS